ncbi:MAG: MarR family transcriptional regulator [Planctomycetota bacterium]
MPEKRLLHPDLPAGSVTAVNQPVEVAILVDSACCLVAAGKRTAQQVAAWGAPVNLNETEFRLLWRLSRDANDCAPSSGVDAEPGLTQRALAEALAVSPAQLCASVAQLAERGLVDCRRSRRDRRRQLCTTTAAGRRLIAAAVGRLVSRPTEDQTLSPLAPRPEREAA